MSLLRLTPLALLLLAGCASQNNNDQVLDLSVAPEVTDFEGFIEYGSPIETSGTDSLGQAQMIVLTG